MEFGGWGGGEDLGGVRGRETTIRIYFIKKCFQLKIKEYYFSAFWLGSSVKIKDSNM